MQVLPISSETYRNQLSIVFKKSKLLYKASEFIHRIQVSKIGD